MEFEKDFATENDCIAYIVQVKWPYGYSCTNCGSKEYWYATRKRIKCKKCEHTITITAGTVFDQTNKPISLWFRAIWWMIGQKTGVSAAGLQTILGIGSYKTAWFWLHKIRELMVLPERKMLSGKIEIDETLVGGRKQGKRGRGSENKVLVIIAIEILPKGTGRVRLLQIDSASKKELHKFVSENIETGSTIICDGWKGYSFLESVDYKQIIQRQVVASTEEEMLPNVHRVASLLKRWLIGTHQNYTSEERLQNYLDEFVFRYNRRKTNSRGLLFYRIIEQAMNHTPVLYKNIRAKSINYKKKNGGK